MVKTVLIVDDSPSIRQMVSFILDGAGLESIEAVDGQDGLDKAKEQNYSLILSDQHMPRMDGLSLIQALRALPQYKTVPILMLSTDADAAMKARAHAIGATDWLSKPVDPQKLIDVIRKLIG